MAVSEHDLETLEVWLDGGLSEEQVEPLRRRLSVEPELAQSLDRLRSDRQLRAGFFQTLEPSGAEIETLVSNARRGVRREDMINSRLRALRNVSGIAASIAIVFMAGWLSHGRLQVGPVKPVEFAGGSTQRIIVPVNVGTVLMPANPGVRMPPSGTMLVSGETPVEPLTLNTPGRPLYKVRVTDPLGQVVFDSALQKLDDLKDLPEQILAADQARQGVVRPQNSPPIHVNTLKP